MIVDRILSKFTGKYPYDGEMPWQVPMRGEESSLCTICGWRYDIGHVTDDPQVDGRRFIPSESEPFERSLSRLVVLSLLFG
jgi:hypothetical protein